MPKTPRALIFEFQKIMRDAYGVKLTLEDAREASLNLLETIMLIAEVASETQDEDS
jgi:hypothetical protein